MAGGVSFKCGHQAVRSLGAVENQVTWCRYTQLRRSAILWETFSLGVIAKTYGSSWCLDTPGTIRRCLQHASRWEWAPRTLIALVFLDTLGTKRHYPRVGLSSGVGTKRAEIRAKLPWCLDTPWTIRRCCNRPFHGRGHQSVTLSQVFRHAEDDTTLRSTGLSSSVDTRYR